MTGNKTQKVWKKLLSAFLVFAMMTGTVVTPSNAAAEEEILKPEEVVSETSDSGSEGYSTDKSQVVKNIEEAPEDPLGLGTAGSILCYDKTLKITLDKEEEYKNESLKELFKEVFENREKDDEDEAASFAFYPEETDAYESLLEFLEQETKGNTDGEIITCDELSQILDSAESFKLADIKAPAKAIAAIKISDKNEKSVIYLVSTQISEEEATDENDEAADSASSASSASADTEDESAADVSLDEDPDTEVSFKIEPGLVMYGESGDNSTGCLDTLFAPSYSYEGKEYLPVSVQDGEKEGDFFNTSYKFVTQKEDLPEMTEEAFDAIEGEELQSIPAGTTVYVIARATAGDMQSAFAESSFTMEKRKVSVRFEAPMDFAINEKTEPEDEKLVFEQEQAKDLLTVEVIENESNPEGVSTFCAGQQDIMPKELVAGDVTLDVSQVDYENIGYQEVPMVLELNDEFLSNYEIQEEELVGYVYVDETTFTLTFKANNNGLEKELKYVIDQNYVAEDKTLTDVLKRLGKYSEVYPNMSGFFSSLAGETITGWIVTQDAASNTGEGARLDPEFMYESDYDGEEKYPFYIQKRTDYYLTATVCKRASENIYIESTPTVIYNGKAHVIREAGYSKSNDADLELYVLYSEDGLNPGRSYVLRYGKDYKVSYKNNKAASMKMTANGEYEPLYTAGTDDKKRPCAVITGINGYKGFSATAYFDILPADIGEGTPATITGIKNSYVLSSSGKLKGFSTPKVTWSRYHFDGRKSSLYKASLKLGKDYEQKLYVYSSGIWKECENSNPGKITEEGKYLYTVRGIGNYCGTAFGQEDEDTFNDGKEGAICPTVCSYVGTDIMNCQFIVIGDASQDLANASVKVKKTQLSYKRDTSYSGADFGITVTIGKGSDKRVLTEGKDYYITFDGVDFDYVISRTGNICNMDVSSEIYEGSKDNNAKIALANKYAVRITAIEGNDNGIFGTKTAKSVRIKGIRIDPGWFTLNSPSLKYDGNDKSAFKYRYNYRSKVTVKDALTFLKYDSNGDSNYQRDKEKLTYNAVFVMYNAHNKNPGSYVSTIYPAGPGVDHDYYPKVKFTRTGITVKEAMKKGIIKVRCGSADYNAGGSLPKDVVITINGHDNYIEDMKCNGQPVSVDDGGGRYGTYVTLTLTASGNTKTGNSAGLYITGDGKVFKGKSSKTVFSVDPITITDYTIPVLHGDDYIREYGKKLNYVDKEGIYAVCEPVAKPAKGLPKYKITLYQAYIKNQADYSAYYNGVVRNRYSLAKISSSQYKAVLTESGTNSYRVDIKNSKAKVITGFDFRNVKLSENYTVYDKSASIVGATAVINGIEYSFPADANKPVAFTGSQIRFDKKAGDGVTSITLKDGTVLGPDNFRVEYGDNVSVGKKKGTFTVILKENSEGTYKGGGKATFKFTIEGAQRITL